MQHHRFMDLMNQSAPHFEPSVPLSTGFMFCPLVPAYPVAIICAWQQMIYQMALQQAQNQRKSPLPNYELASAWN